MANISPVTNLDFFATKEALKTFLKNQDRFKDYDYEGSNMNVLLDVLSYNTFYNTITITWLSLRCSLIAHHSVIVS